MKAVLEGMHSASQVAESRPNSDSNALRVCFQSGPAKPPPWAQSRQRMGTGAPTRLLASEARASSVGDAGGEAHLLEMRRGLSALGAALRALCGAAT